MLITILLLSFAHSFCSLDIPSEDTKEIFQWECTYYANNIFEKLEFKRANGLLEVEHLSDQINLSFVVDNDTSYLSLYRNKTINYNQDKDNYQLYSLSPIFSLKHEISPILHQLAYVLLLRENSKNKDQLRLIQRILLERQLEDIREFKPSKDGKKITFQSFDKNVPFDQRSRVSQMIGVLHLDEASDLYLDCHFEIYNNMGCCDDHEKGIFSMKRL